MSAQVIPVNVQVAADPRAPVVADLPVQALRVAYASRRDLEQLPEGDWGVPGVYVLLTDDGSGDVYVGQAVHLRKRLLQHRSKPKLTWRRAAAIQRDTSHGFNSAEIGYLEGRLAAEIGAVPGVNVVEGLRSHDMTLPAHHMVALDALLPGIFAALRVTGVDLAKEADAGDLNEKHGGTKRSHTVIPGTVADLVAAGLLRAGTELWCSRAGRTGSARVSTSGELILAGVAYASPSRAAATAFGRPSANGWKAWHVGDETGPTLAELRAQLPQRVAGDPS